ncbi:zinc binding domain containing protein DUF701, putative [Babesia ovis]|uniref:Transcription elongation factor 1 homolog n=1 Tax=Babesia ovis TaxID=5869 RepID=A0A9W5WVY3_BABOV|nr:zinc binding domain containing protein DUF701, putative [Babesia ovis]
MLSSDNQSGVGLLSCRICGVKFSTRVTVLDEAIDVYSLWMDSCRESQQLDATSLRTNGETNRGENHGIESKTQVRSTAATVKHSPQTSDIPVVKGGGTPEVLGSQTKTNEHLPKHKFVDEVSSTVFSGISGGNRSKRIIDATEETGTVPAFTVDTLKGESLFDDD